MAEYRPDYKFIDAKKHIDELNDELVNYYIEKRQKIIDEQNKKIESYRKFFEQMGKFIPKY